MANPDQHAAKPPFTLAQVFGAAPGALEGLRQIRKAIADTGVSPKLLELVFLRSSQLNGCAYCIGYHVLDAKRAGVSERQLHLLAAWRDADAFDEHERAVLAFAEAATHIAGHQALASGPLAAEVIRLLGDKGFHALALALAYINAWNRIGAIYAIAAPPELGA